MLVSELHEGESVCTAERSLTATAEGGGEGTTTETSAPSTLPHEEGSGGESTMLQAAK